MKEITAANLREASLIRQIECPSVAKPRYNTETPSLTTPISKNSSLKYVFNKAIPHALGYMSYNFTGIGSNDAPTFAEKAGISGSYAASSRILGYNYFQPTGVTCNSQSTAACKEKEQHMYIRNYPAGVTGKGNVSFAMFDDVVDLNPIPLIKSLIAPGLSGRCVMSPSYDVGSAIDSKGSDRLFGSEQDFVDHHNTCVKQCPKRHSANADVENCLKNCFRGHWKEKQCVSAMAAPPRTEDFFGGGANKSSKKTNRRRPTATATTLLFSTVVLCMMLAVLVRRACN
jgi:hypothetical protein